MVSPTTLSTHGVWSDWGFCHVRSPLLRAIQYHSRPKMNQLRVKEAMKRKITKRHRISTKVVQKSARKAKCLLYLMFPYSMLQRPSLVTSLVLRLFRAVRQSWIRLFRNPNIFYRPTTYKTIKQRFSTKSKTSHQAVVCVDSYL